MPDHVGPRRHPAWVDALVQVVMVALGVLCILYPIVHRAAHAVAYLVTGLVLLGIVRLSDLIPARQTPRRQPRRGTTMTTATPPPDPDNLPTDDENTERVETTERVEKNTEVVQSPPTADDTDTDDSGNEPTSGSS